MVQLIITILIVSAAVAAAVIYIARQVISLKKRQTYCNCCPQKNTCMKITKH